jgi:hypothetical protein
LFYLVFVDSLWANVFMKAIKNRKTVEVKRGNVTVKIYQGVNRIGDVDYPQFTLAYYEGGVRKKKSFANLAEARREAEFTAEKISKGEGQVLNLTSTDRTIYVQAVEHLRPLNTPLNIAVLEYVSVARHRRFCWLALCGNSAVGLAENQFEGTAY